MTSRLALAFSLALFGCDNSVTGQPLGKPFVVASTMARQNQSTVNSSYQVFFSDRAGDLKCAGADGGSPSPEGAQNVLVVVSANGSQLPVTGAYNQTGSTTWTAVFACVVSGGYCSLAQAATSEVTLTEASTKRIAGKFTAEMSNGQAFSGTFGADLCP